MGGRRVPAERTASTFEDHNAAQFGVPTTSFDHQFANLYFARLAELRPRAEAAACAKWGESVLEQRVKTLDAEPDSEALIVGTVYNEMKNKPNIMDEFTRDVLEERPAADESDATKYCGDDDVLLLEDDSGRLALRMPEGLSSRVLITGVVVAVRGKLNETGELLVEDICLPGLPPQRALNPTRLGDRYVALVSGLHIGHSTQSMLPLQLLIEHLTGQLGCDEDHRLQANIVRLIIAGNAACAPTSGSSDGGGWQASDVLKKMAQSEQKALADNVRTLDQFLTAASASMPVDVMPGSDDPSSFLLPQQPLHPCMLPHASQLSTLNLCTNPYCCDIDGVRFLGSSGQPLDDMQRYLPSDDRLGTLAASLEFQHLAPTAPDTLGCYPFETNDPFIVRECPHVYFAGNQPRFGTTEVCGAAGQRVRTILVPDFGIDQTCVLVNLDSLECRPISFAGFGESMVH
jgi:DNA polymerase delta subunit 2